MDDASYAAVMRNLRHVADFIRTVDFDELLAAATARQAHDTEMSLIILLSGLADDLPGGHH